MEPCQAIVRYENIHVDSHLAKKEEDMKPIVLAICALTFILGTVVACSNAVDKRASKPAVMERIKQDAVTGEVVDIGKTYVSIKDDDGVINRVRVDDATKMDMIQKGDRVKAYVDDAGYATTLQRLAT
jgi:hypothetical protein